MVMIDEIGNEKEHGRDERSHHTAPMGGNTPLADKYEARHEQERA